MVFKILGLVSTVTFSVLSLIMEKKRKTKLSDDDIELIAEKVATKVKTKRIPPTKKDEE